MKRNYNVYTSSKCNHNVITFLLCNYKVITKYIGAYIVITFYPFTAAALTFDTPLADGRLIYGHLSPGEHLFVQERTLNIGKNTTKLFEVIPDTTGRFVLGIPQDSREFSLTLQDTTGSKQMTFPVSETPWKQENISGLPPAKVIPPPADQARITAEALALRQARATSTYPAFPATWTRPVPKFKRISSFFGSRRILNGVKKQGHSGTDYAAPTGTPVVAPAPGRVVLTHPDLFFSGQTVLIDHGFGVFSSYSHLSDIKVKENQTVSSKEIIGSVGTTGRSTGPHLHFTLTWYGVRVDPEPLFTHPQQAER